MPLHGGGRSANLSGYAFPAAHILQPQTTGAVRPFRGCTGKQPKVLLVIRASSQTARAHGPDQSPANHSIARTASAATTPVNCD